MSARSQASNLFATRTVGGTARLGGLALAALLASGCSVLESDRIDYKSAKRASTLEVPPDLSQISRDSRL